MGQGTSIRIVVVLVGILTILVALPTRGFGDVPQQFNFQGLLSDATGNPLDGTSGWRSPSTPGANKM